MSEWWTYSLSDFLMFSARTYHRLFALYHRDIWPAQLVALGAGMLVIAAGVSGGARWTRLAALLTGLAWCWVAWAFHLDRYAAINTAAPWFAAGFVLQGLLLLWTAAGPVSRLAGFGGSARSVPGLAILLLSVAAYPVLPSLQRSWQAPHELFGIAPDPTAMATLGLLLTMRAHWSMWVLPVAWCAISGATLLALRAPLAWLPPAVAVAAMAAAIVVARLAAASAQPRRQA